MKTCASRMNARHPNSYSMSSGTAYVSAHLRSRLFLTVFCLVFLAPLQTSFAQEQSWCVNRGGTTHECRDPDLGSWGYSAPVTQNEGIGPFVSESELTSKFTSRMNELWPCGFELLSIEQAWTVVYQEMGYEFQLRKSVAFRVLPSGASGCYPPYQWSNGWTGFYKQRKAELGGTWRRCPGGNFRWLWNPAQGPALCGRPRTMDICLGNPINPATRAKLTRDTDYQNPANPLLSLTRQYDSQGFKWSGAELSSTMLGYRWRAGSDRSITTFGTGDGSTVTYRDANGRGEYFRRSGTAFSPMSDARSVLAATFAGDGSILSWTVRTPQHTVETFDAAGRLKSVSDLTGRRIDYLYDGAGRLLQAVDHFGRALSYSVPAPSTVRVELPDGLAVDYDFGATGPDPLDLGTQLRTVRFDGTDVASYVYGETTHIQESTSLPHVLTGLVDGNSTRFGNYRYDSSGGVISTEALQGINKFTVDTQTSCGQGGFAATDALGTRRTSCLGLVGGVMRVMQNDQPAGAGCGPASSSITYDANANIASRTDFNNSKICYGNDLSRNLETARVEGLSGAASCPTDVGAYTPAANTPQRKILTQWHPDWRLETRRSEPKRISTTVYNGQPDPTAGNAIVTCAPADALVDGKPIAVVCRRIEQATSDDTGGSGFAATAVGAARITSYTYNRYGQVLTVNGPRTDVTDLTTYEYYPDTQADWTFGDLKQVTNAVGKITRFTQYDRNGRLLQSIDPNGVVTEHQYHPRGWLTQTKVTPAGGGTAQTTSYDYDGVGQLKRVTHPDSSTVTYTYDLAHRLTAVEDSAGNRVEYTLDAMGNRTQEDWKDSAGTLRKTLTRVVDALNRVQTVVGGVQ